MTDARARAAVRNARAHPTPEATTRAVHELVRSGGLLPEQLQLLAYAGNRDAQAALGPENLHRILGSMCSCRGADKRHAHSPLRTPPLEAWLAGLTALPCDYNVPLSGIRNVQLLVICLLAISTEGRARAIRSLGCYACESYFSEHAGSPCTCEENRAWAEDTAAAFKAVEEWLACPCELHAQQTASATSDSLEHWCALIGRFIRTKGSHISYPLIQDFVNSARAAGLCERDMFRIASAHLIATVAGTVAVATSFPVPALTDGFRNPSPPTCI